MLEHLFRARLLVGVDELGLDLHLADPHEQEVLSGEALMYRGVAPSLNHLSEGQGVVDSEVVRLVVHGFAPV